MRTGDFLAGQPRSGQTADDEVLVEGVPLFTGIVTLSLDECIAFLTTSRVGRIAVSVGALPVIFPVNYLAFDGAVWFRAASNGTLMRASVGSVVAFEADGYDDIGSFGWSVLVRGVADEVSDSRKIQEVSSRFVDAWPLGERADRYIVVPATMLTGQRYA